MTQAAATDRLAAIILAAGKGTRMKSATPKVLHKVAGLPMLGHAVKALDGLGLERLVLVLAADQDKVAEAAKDWVKDPSIVASAVQDPPKGTGHAVMAAMPALDGVTGDVIVAFGDTPLVRSETYEALLAPRRAGADIVVSGFRATGPHMYGRLVLDGAGALQRIVEHKDATEEERAIDLCNGGIMLIAGDHLAKLLSMLSDDNAQGEFYLTDMVEHAKSLGLTCAVAEGNAEDVLGVNSRVELAGVEAIMQDRLRHRAMVNGATLSDPASTYFSWDTLLGQDVEVGPHVTFGLDVKVADNVTIHAYSHLEGCIVHDGAQVGPYARLRPGAELMEGAKVGNFVELKKTRLGAGAKANHLAYLGDADIGPDANVGAGTITCNYDGFDKFSTTIGARAFIGSNSTLVAPVTIEDDGFTGAGSTITKKVEAGALGVGRGKQSNIAGWVARFRSQKAKKADKKKT